MLAVHLALGDRGTISKAVRPHDKVHMQASPPMEQQMGLYHRLFFGVFHSKTACYIPVAKPIYHISRIVLAHP